MSEKNPQDLLRLYITQLFYFAYGVGSRRRIVRRVRRRRVNTRKYKRSATAQKEYIAQKEYVRQLVLTKIEQYNQYYGFMIKCVSIKNQKTRWGSCSSKGNLNFNMQLALLPEYLIDYVVVHEICHLKEFNHSYRFWNLVAEQIPEYALCRKQLKHFRL